MCAMILDGLHGGGGREEPRGASAQAGVLFLEPAALTECPPQLDLGAQRFPGRD